MMNIQLISPKAKMPKRGTNQSAGYDIFPAEFPVTIRPKTRETISTGIKLAIPPGHYGQIAPRSGLAHKTGIDTLAGVIDADYRGEIKVILYNTSDEDYIIEDNSTAIAQLLIIPVSWPQICAASDLDETDRGDKGFGSTDKK